MVKLSSLRGRFLLAILLWVALGIGAIWYSSVRLFTTHVEALFHEELEVHVRELGELTGLDAQGRPRLTRPLSDPRYAVPLSGFYWQVTRPGVGTIKSPSMSRGQLDYDIAHSPNILHRVEDGPTGHAIVYGFVRTVPQGAPVHFVIATDERHLQRFVKAFTRELSVWLGLLALALVASGLAIITFGFRPLQRLSNEIDRLRQGSAARIDGAYPDEVQGLVSDLNAYVGRNAEIVERGRVQSAALAHSLRTPLAIITDEAERLQEADPDSPAARTFLEESDKMQRQIDYHLARSRSGGSRVGMAGRSSLAAIAPGLLSAMHRCHPDKSFAMEGAVESFDPVAMDADDLSEILSNLLDNAGKWARHRVTLRALDDARGRRIVIADDGPGVDPARRETMFEIGRSGDHGPVGTGLGLAIARDLARDYGADVVLATTEQGEFCAEIRLDTAPA